MKKSGNSFNITNFKPTDSQERIFQIFPFGGESAGGGGQSSSDDSELLTGIMMVSVSESSQEDYQTPPEHHSRSQNSTNDPPPPPLDLQVKSDDDHDTEPLGQNIVDLTIDSDHDHDHLGFTEETYVVQDDHHDSLMVDKNDTQPIETRDGPENLVTEAFETELISSSPPVENADKVFDQMPKKGDVASTSATAAVKATILNRGKRKLPFSIDSKDQTSQDNQGNEAFSSIMDRVLSLLGGMPKHDNATDDADIDLIETAKMRGMTFPRPRWWPPEGSNE